MFPSKLPDFAILKNNIKASLYLHINYPPKKK